MSPALTPPFADMLFFAINHRYDNAARSMFTLMIHILALPPAAFATPRRAFAISRRYYFRLPLLI